MTLLGLGAGIALALYVGIAQPDLRTFTFLCFAVSGLALLVAGGAALSKVKRENLSVGNFVLLLGSMTFALLSAELGLRVFLADSFMSVTDEHSLLYGYDSTLGWFPRPNSRHIFTGSRKISIQHNSRGFRDTETKDRSRPALVFLGDSFVWGYDAEAPERFTDKLQVRHPEVTVYNFGVSGYGTDQSFILLQQQLRNLTPKLVFLVFCSENDEEDNCWNFRHGSYYKPYFTFDTNGLHLQGVPVPHSEKTFRVNHPVLCSSYVARLLVRVYYQAFTAPPTRVPNPTQRILLEMGSFLHQRGIPFAVGFTLRYPSIQNVLESARIPCVDLTTTNRYAGPSGHWTPAGHDFVCDQIERFLYQSPELASLLRKPILPNGRDPVPRP